MNRFIMNSHASSTLQGALAGLVGAARDAAVRLFDTLAEWQARAMERRHLMGLDARLLRDAGLSHADAAAEYAKPFWRA